MQIFISTGEVSGDLQGALLVQSLYQQAQQQGISLDLVGLGGDRMAEAGAQILFNTAQIGSIGLLESLPFVLPTLQAQKIAKQYFLDHPPAALILIDYHDPNVALGRFVRKRFPQMPILYYIAPQTWVWSPTQRATQEVVELTDRVLAIFPAEARFYQERGATVEFVGHPLVDRMQNAPSRLTARQQLGFDPDQTLVTLLPASRRQEIKYLLPPMLEVAQQLQAKIPEIQFLLPLSLKIYESQIRQQIAQSGLNIQILEDQTLEAIAAADLALTKSGTVNLEIALLKVPQIVLYRVHGFTIWLARTLFRFSIPFMSPVNLVLMREIVPEFLQEEIIPEQMVQEALELLHNPQRRQQMAQDYQAMQVALGEAGNATRAAQAILNYVIRD